MEPRHVDALLVGGGVAAARCARALRRGGFAGSILLVGDEPVPPYNRPPLSKELLRDEVPEELLLAEPRSWYERRDVELRLGLPATSLQPDARLVELADGTRLHYGNLLLATGAEPRRPPVEAMLLRTIADARAIRDEAQPGRRAVVIGGGFIGVELAASLASRGAAVTIFELAPALWAGAFGGAVSDWALERLRAAGVEVRLGIGADTEDLAGADLVLAGVGVEPRVVLAAAAGLEVDDGIAVDARQATSETGIYAAGDVARNRGRPRVEHWHAARESGERAGLAMLGVSVPPLPAPWIFSEFAGAKLDVLGIADRGDESAEVAPGVHVWVRGGAVAQLAILDGAVPIDVARSLVDRGAPPDELAALTVGS
jgi:3-phenylpropionate/trans-cinnamate dioxygenase ferredoxin reductase subunit